MRRFHAVCRVFQIVSIVGLALASAERAVAEPSVDDAERAYRRLHVLDGELADLRRLLASPGSKPAADALDAAQDELRSAAQHVCRALYRARLLAARDALANEQDAAALEHLLGAEATLHECAQDAPAPAESPDEEGPGPVRILSRR